MNGLKKIAFSVVAIALMGTAFAALPKPSTTTQYPEAYTGIDYNYADGIFSFNKNYVWADFSRRIDLSAERNKALSLDEITEFGYYTVDDSGAKTGEYVKLYSSDGTTNNSAIFDKDQKIGIYMDIEKTTTTAGHYEYQKVAKTDKYGNVLKDKKGNIQYEYKNVWVEGTSTTETSRYTTTATSDDETVTGTSKIDPDSWVKTADGFNSPEQYFCLFTEGQTPGTSTHFEYFFSGRESTDSENIDEFVDELQKKYGDDVINPDNLIVDGEKYTPNGQPLPGILLTLVLGGGALAGGKAARKRNRK